MEQPRFEEVEHTADWALRIRGENLRELFVNAARGMNQLLVVEPDVISLEREELFALEEADAESLLVAWLSELAYWAEMERLIFREFRFSQIEPTQLKVTVRGGYAVVLKKHIKAVTYHNLQITTDKNGYLQTIIIFDV